MDANEIEIWVTMDEDGDYAVAKCDDDIDAAGDGESLKPMRRLVCIKAKMNPPVHQELTCTIPDHGDQPVEIVDVTSV